MTPREEQSSQSSPVKGGATTLLLDMDGVLAEVSKSYRAAIIATCHEHGATSITQEVVGEWKARGGCNNDWVLSLDLIGTDPNGKKGLTLEQVTETFERFYQGDAENNVEGLYKLEGLIPPKDLLEQLKRRCDGGKMAIVTGRPKKDCDMFLETHGIADLFDASVCMEDGPPKPDPFPIVEACKRLGVEPGENVVMVGDTPDDIVAAVKAGCTGVGVVTPEAVVSAKEEGKPFDSGALSEAMKAAGAATVLEPGFGDLLTWFPDPSQSG